VSARWLRPESWPESAVRIAWRGSSAAFRYRPPPTQWSRRASTGWRRRTSGSSRPLPLSARMSPVSCSTPWPTSQRTASAGPGPRSPGGLPPPQPPESLYEPRLFPDPEYTFRHALPHEVAYASLVMGRRRPLHAGLVDAIERLSPNRLTEHAERLAHHAVR